MIQKNNILDFSKCARDFRHPDLRFSVSTRDIRPETDILMYLKIVYIYLDIDQITDVFGNCIFPSRLYGGRPYNLKYALTDEHVRTLEKYGIGLSLTLTNHFFDETSYRHSYEFLKTLHKKGNSIICTSDELAIRIRNDFPDYTLKASIIKNLNTPVKIEKALRLYDYVTLPMDRNDDDKFLETLADKDRIILFGNANCAYTCPNRTCYLGFSQTIQGKPASSGCSRKKQPRLDLGQVWFNVAKLKDMGYTFFKMIPPVAPEAGDIARQYSSGYQAATRPWRPNKPVAWLCSYPKCGRSWLRFIIANYLNLRYRLGLKIDFHSIFRLLPNDWNDPLKGFGAYRYAEDQRFPMLLASHSACRAGWPGNDRVIVLLRSIPDVVVSDYFHTSRLLKIYSGPLKDFLRDRRGGLHRYLRYLNSWADFIRTGQPHLVRYENLHAQTTDVMAGVLAFLSIPLDLPLLEEAINRSTFEVMLEIEGQKGIAGHQYEFEDPEVRRVRKGQVNGYRQYLDEEDMDHIKAICRQYPRLDGILSCT